MRDWKLARACLASEMTPGPLRQVPALEAIDREHLEGHLFLPDAVGARPIIAGEIVRQYRRLAEHALDLSNT